RLPDHRADERTLVDVHGHALTQLDLGEVGLVLAIGRFGPRAGIGVVVEHARHAAARELSKILDAGDDGHGETNGKGRRTGTGRWIMNQRSVFRARSPVAPRAPNRPSTKRRGRGSSSARSFARPATASRARRYRARRRWRAPRDRPLRAPSSR